VGGKSSQGGDSHKGSRYGASQQPTLLLQVQDVASAQLLNSLRTKLSTFLNAVLSKGMTSNLSRSTENEIGAVFNGLESLIEQSHSLYMTDDGLRGDNMDPDILEVIHLHHSAHCKIVDRNESGSNNDIEIDSDDDVAYNDKGRDGDRWTGGSSDGTRRSWRGGRGRSKRGRGGNWGRHGGAKRGRGNRW